MEKADILEDYLLTLAEVRDAKVFDRTGDIVLRYRGDRAGALRILSRFSFSDEAVRARTVDHTARALSHEYADQLLTTVVWRGFKRLFLPLPVRTFFTVLDAVQYISRGIGSLFSGGIRVELLDATAIAVSLFRRDFDTASNVMFMLKLGDILEEWTHKKSVSDLARTMSLHVDNVWLLTKNGEEVLVKSSEITVGDEIIVRTGQMIPFDGKVSDGEATVNQSSITGESLPVLKKSGSIVYAGTVVEEGFCVIRVEKGLGAGRYDRIVKMIEESEALKSATEDRAMRLADRLVPYTFLGTALTYFLTGNVTKAVSVLMVDFSCALKLAMPIAVLSAMREAGLHHISVKGGKFLENIAEADTIVFDKTGTLTHSLPRVAAVVAFGGYEEKEMLRLAACLEEHYPHSIANAVVRAAEEEGLIHEERHTKVEYVVAHGISSTIDGEKVVIGSFHFVFEDESCRVPKDEEARFAALPDEYSQLYLAIGGVLSAVILIEDPLRDEAAAVLSGLRALGISHLVMMTGDNERTAAAIAKEVGVDLYFSEVLPEDKAGFIKTERKKGRKVIMIGDGVNDSPALSEADAGIAISDGAAIAREVADITIAADDLRELLVLKRLSDGLMRRIRQNYRFIISFNGLLILLGLLGILPPTASALLHNGSTILIGLHSMTNLLEEKS